MGPWVHTCRQCGGKSYFNPSDMLLPELMCRHCGSIKINLPEERERMRQLLEEDNWYAGFLELLFKIEEGLGIEYEEVDFPRPFVTWRQLLEVTGRRCGALTAEEILSRVAAFSSLTVMDIRQMMDMPVYID